MNENSFWLRFVRTQPFTTTSCRPDARQSAPGRARRRLCG
jgi:hypothetical protein